MKTHQTCPKCGAREAYTEFEVGRGFCHSKCGNVFIGERKKVQQEDTTQIGSVTFNGIRSIDPDVCKKYGIQLQLDPTGKEIRYAFKYPNNTKYRGFEEKKFAWKERGVGATKFFGPTVNAGASKRIYITEGEFDAASLYQALGQTYPVFSLPSASISEDFLKSNHTWLKSFPEVVYAGELDDAGRKAAEKIYRVIPSSMYYVPLTKHKDANDFLKAGDESELKWAALKPQRWTPENFFCSDEQVDKIIREENPYEYTSTGHKGLDEKIRGLVKGGVMFLKAPPGSGKTELFRFFEHNLLENSGTKIALVHMEEQKSTTYRAMASYKLGVNVRTKDDAIENSVTEDSVIKAAQEEARGDRTIVFEMKSGDDPMEILEYIRIASSVYGAEYIFVDHVQRLAYLGGIEGATGVLTKLAANLAQLAKELNIGVVMISHVNEDGRTKYAASLEEEAIICVRIERDKESTDATDRNTTKFFVEKNRPFSRLGYAGAVFFDEESTLLSEVEV